jgi:hypothetical protein
MSVTSGALLSAVHVSPENWKVVRPRGSQRGSRPHMMSGPVTPVSQGSVLLVAGWLSGCGASVVGGEVSGGGAGLSSGGGGGRGWREPGGGDIGHPAAGLRRRRSWPDQQPSPVACSCPVLLDRCHPSGRGRRVKAREATGAARRSRPGFEDEVHRGLRGPAELAVPGRFEHLTELGFACLSAQAQGDVLGERVRGADRR